MSELTSGAARTHRRMMLNMSPVHIHCLGAIGNQRL